MNKKQAIENKNKDQGIHCKIHAMSHEGRGIASVQQKTVFIDNALLDETVEISYLKKSRRYDEAKAIQILQASPMRVDPACIHFNLCGGCALQHMSSETQLQHKEKVLLENLAHFGKVIPEKILPPLVGPVTGYRRKARLGVRFVPKKGGILLGFREKHSNKLAELNSCEVLHPSVGKNIEALKQLIQSMDSYLAIPQIEVAVGDNACALIFRHLAPLSEACQQKLMDFGHAKNLRIYLQAKGPESIHLLWPKESEEDLFYSLPDYHLKLYFKPQDFIQVNGVMNQQMVKTALNLLQPNENDSILDLYCGLGNFSLPLAQTAKQVIGVEGCAKMTERANENALKNGLMNTSFQVANLEQGLGEMLINKIRALALEKILLDPPRTGAEKVVHDLTKEACVSKIVYVSCNPATLARDIGILVREGNFCLKSVQILDMFPHTAHVETMALLERSSNPIEPNRAKTL